MGKGQSLLPEEVITSKIYMVRGHKVMLDRDLAELYGVETKRLKEAVRRNISRFPEDFMFEMTKEELENWRTQFASSKGDLQGLRYVPFCFTEQGVTMLSCVLNSETAIQVNIQIIRVFTKIREMLQNNKDILLKLEQLEKNLLKQDHRQDKQEEDIQLIFQYLKQLLNPAVEPRDQIGFKPGNKKQS
ncbi:ORF6N domain-containing protein [Pleomorphovibrio marinus]|uniref:ORF6N domain-containing protein n=1 Tax=Pleomorphovibrio marinus TaxID=2164132 RepID=UPI000E09EF37|nr:ORF6N domain-containing protein [Pleomorphovibrio marinus]